MYQPHKQPMPMTPGYTCMHFSQQPWDFVKRTLIDFAMKKKQRLNRHDPQNNPDDIRNNEYQQSNSNNGKPINKNIKQTGPYEGNRQRVSNQGNNIRYVKPQEVNCFKQINDPHKAVTSGRNTKYVKPQEKDDYGQPNDPHMPMASGNKRRPERYGQSNMRRGDIEDSLDSQMDLNVQMDSVVSRFLQKVNQSFPSPRQGGNSDSDSTFFKNKVKRFLIPNTSKVKARYLEQLKNLAAISQQSTYADVMTLFGSLTEEKQEFRAKLQEVNGSLVQLLQTCHAKYQTKLEDLAQKQRKLKQQYFDFYRTTLLDNISEDIPPFPGTSAIHKRSRQAQSLSKDLASNSISSNYNIAFDPKTFSGLSPQNWLHNTVLDNYIQFLKQIKGYNDPNNPNPVAVYSFGDAKKFEFASTFKFSTGQKIFTKYKRLGMVINQKNQHWLFIGVLPQKNVMIIYDSIPRKRDNYTHYLTSYQEFIDKEYAASGLSSTVKLTLVHEETCPKQVGGSDCGIQVLINLTLFLQGKDKEFKLAYDIGNNNQVRLGMYLFMAYLLELTQQRGGFPKYDMLEYCSRSVILNPNSALLRKP